MLKKTVKLVHLAAWIRGRGGVETLLERHRAGDRAHSVESAEMGLFDRPARKTTERQYAPTEADVKAAAAVVRDLLTLPPQAIDEKCLLARELARVHEATDYVAEFAEFAHRLAPLPGVSREARGERGTRWVDWLPLGLVTRAFPREFWR